MYKEQFDVVVNFQGKGKTANPFINQFKAGITVSFSGEDIESTDLSIRYEYLQSEVIRCFELTQEIGADFFLPDAKIWPLESDKKQASDIIRRAGSESFMIINPFSNDLRRTWPVENFIPVIRELTAAGMRIILTGSQEQRHELEQLNECCGGYCYNSAGQLHITALAALIQYASLLVGPDTGPLHMARAVGTPTVGIYWAPNLINWGPLTRNEHRPVISWNMACPLCGIIPVDPYPFLPDDHCRHEVSFVRDISPARVTDEIFKSLFTASKSAFIK
jgi:ADP-heptose:LPS heptosyltransferase